MVTLLSVLLVSSLAQTYQAAPARAGDMPVVNGDAAFQDKVSAALGVLQADYPDDYANVTFWLTSISQTDAYTCVNNSGDCLVTAGDYNASYYWLASVLIHEAQHVADDHIYFVDHPYSDYASEQRALTAQAAYLASMNGWTQAQADAWVDGWLAQQYWITIPAKYAGQH